MSSNSNDVDLPHEITLEGAAFGERNYSFRVDGAVAPATDSTLEDVDSIDGTTVTGGVKQGDTDTYRFSGRIVEFAGGGQIDARVTYNVDDEPGDEPSDEPAGYEFQGEAFRIASTDRTPAMKYTFRVDGAASEGASLEDADSVIETDAGYKVTGTVGPNGSDTYDLEGFVTEFQAVDADTGTAVHETWFETQIAGETTPLWKILGNDEMPPRGHEFAHESFSIRSTARTPAMEYSFEVDGLVEVGASLEDKDQITENDDETYSVTGTVGPKGSDTYQVDGYLASFEAVETDTGDTVESTRFETAVSGEPEELWTLMGLPEPEYSDTGPEAIGGGEHYSQTVTAEDADVVVDTHDDLRRELGTADPGDIVFVDPDAEIYSSTKRERYDVPAGVTLASNRGVDGSDGALLSTDAQYSYGAHGLVSVKGDDARVTGIRVKGPHPDPDGGWREHSYDYEMSGINTRSNGASRVEVDNVEVWGFAHLVAAGEDNHVHHSHLHDANMEGLGYCVSTGSSEGCIIEYNHGEHWRHFVAASGGGGYTARYNLIDPPCLAHAFDQHAPGGTYTELHHNTYRVHDEVDSGDPRAPFATFRGQNVRKARVHHNWSYNEWPPRDEPAGFTDESIVHAKDGGEGWGDIEWWDNHLGTDDPPSSDIGCPR